MNNLLTLANAKTIKGEKKGFLTGILYLAPGRIASRRFNVCPHSSRGCRKVCLYTAGRGVFSNVQAARIRKTRELAKDPKEFISRVREDVSRLDRYASRRGMKLAIRLNGTSDLPWETEAYGRIPQCFPHIQFYDYTKIIRRVLNKRRPGNYHLLFSRTEDNEDACRKVLRAGHTVAAVFDEVPVGSTLWGYEIVDGDEDDLRFLDKKSVIVGVKAKGKARRDTSGFVIRTREKQV